ncbi:MAG: hypothetical protein HY898_37155 [Deltaproteobacteria bacterium]|nr:hypothetical protein [Deltaproteobacteria bacterium]
MDQPFRDLMAPDTEPTDEELEQVMFEARDAATERKAASDAWMRRKLEEAVRQARERLGPAGGR